MILLNHIIKPGLSKEDNKGDLKLQRWTFGAELQGCR